jgi:hypothetical protein
MKATKKFTVVLVYNNDPAFVGAVTAGVQELPTYVQAAIIEDGTPRQNRSAAIRAVIKMCAYSNKWTLQDTRANMSVAAVFEGDLLQE